MSNICFTGENESIEWLLKQGGFCQDALFTAVDLVDTDSNIVKMLIPYVGNIDEYRNSSGETALHRAADNLNYNIAKILLDAGADINIKCTLLQETPLHKALRSLCNLDVPEILLTLLERYCFSYDFC